MTGLSTTPVVSLCVASLPRDTTPVLATLGSRLFSHMFGRCGYSASFIPWQGPLVSQLRCEQLLLFGPLYLAGF
jgi:hypothetical protein